MPSHSADTLRDALIAALRDAALADRGAALIEHHARAFARAQREAGVVVERVIIDVKGLVRELAPRQESVFLPRVVGWTVAGYFAGTARDDT